MSGDMLHDQAKGLVEKFFAEENARALSKYREKLAAEERQEALAKATGIEDPVVVEHLLALGLDSVTIAALGLYPLVAVAWADGELDENERDAILDAAKKKGMTVDDASYAVLEHWLKTPPSATLKDAWKSYVKNLCASISPDDQAALKRDVLGHAKKVAEAAGGFLGLGNKVSAKEKTLLDELEAAFS